MADLRIDRGSAALLIVDVQERLWAAMREDDRAVAERNFGILVELARRLKLPIVLSEQYRKGLGPTIASIVAAIPPTIAASGIAGVGAGEGVHTFEKLEFSCTDAAAWPDIWQRVGREQWIVCGMETHVCVYQTVRGLRDLGARVHVPADAILSRTHENRAIGLGLIERAGGIVTSTETVVFDALGRAEGEDFKALSRLIR